VTPAAELCRACRSELTVDREMAVRHVPVELWRCARCGLFEFADPDWLDAAYADPIADVDVGLPSRCVRLAAVVEALVRSERLGARTHLDFGGGYGLLTRLVRDRGIDMRHHDPFATNLFAHGLEGDPAGEFGAVTMIEVLEHLTNPLDVLADLATRSELIIASTVLVPPGLTDLGGWWYLLPDLGQHITFYTPASLREIADRIGFDVTSDGVSVHVLHRRRLSRPAALVMRDLRFAPPVARVLRRRDPLRTFGEQDAAAALASLAGPPDQRDGLT
jgi:hypothetical protein